MAGTTPTCRPARPDQPRARSAASSSSASTSSTAPSSSRCTGQLQAAATAGGQPKLLIGGRPGGRLDPARPVGAADDVGQADGHRRSDVGRPGAGHGHGVGAPRPRLQRRPRAGRGRAAEHAARSCTVLGRTFSIYPTKAQPSRECLRDRPRVEGHRADDEALPGHRTDAATTPTSTSSTLRAVAGRRWRPASSRTRTAIADHIPLIMLSNATYTRLRQRQRRRLVARDLDRPAARSARVQGRQHHRLAPRHGQGARHRDVAPRRPGGARRART